MHAKLSIINLLGIFIIGTGLLSCGISQDKADIAVGNVDMQTPKQATGSSSPQAFPPTICQRFEGRNYLAALNKTDNYKADIVLVGESHGNRNGIEFIKGYIDRRLGEGQKILLGIEAEKDGGFVFERVWADEISLDKGWNRLLSSPYWRENIDGRQSCAIARLMNDLIEAGHNQGDVDLVLISSTPETSKQGLLKGHAMAMQLYNRMIEKNMDDSWSVIALTGRNYQRVRPNYTIEEQSTMCGRLRQISNRDVLCVGTYGSSLPHKERPCPVHEAFDLRAPELLNELGGFYEGLDKVLISPSRCSDFTPRALETRAGFMRQNADPLLGK